MATLNHTNCNTGSPAVLEEVKASDGLQSPETAPEPHAFGGSLFLPPGKMINSKDEGILP